LVESSASKISISHFSIFLSRSSKSYNYLDRTLTLPRYNIAWYVSFTIVINLYLGNPSTPKLWWYHSFIIISFYLLFDDMISYIWTNPCLMNIKRWIISKLLQESNKFIQTTLIKL
jgi:hypothetical protein